MHTRTHKIHHGPYFGEATTFPPYIIFYEWLWGLDANVIFLKILEIRTLATLEAHNFLCTPPIEARSQEKF